MASADRLVLREWDTRDVELDPAVAEALATEHRHVVDLAPLRVGRYRLRAHAYVGSLVVRGFELRIRPKCGLRNVFWMLAWGYGLAEYQRDLVEVEEIEDLRELLLVVLAEQLDHLVRSGIRRGYVEQEDESLALRGRLDFDRLMRRGPSAELRLPCRFEEHTADLPFNQAIAYTLHRVGTSDHPQTAIRLRRLRMAMSVIARPRRFVANDFLGFEYDRLTEHYRPIHALCRIVLDGLGGEDVDGNLPMGSLLVDMNRLFERFVSAWLAKHLPAPWSVRVQPERSLDRGGRLRMRPDLVLEHDGQPRVVMDTKYKVGSAGVPAREDAYQALAYCRALGVRVAVLLYPDLSGPRRFVVVDGDNELRSDGVVLARSVEEVETGLRELMGRIAAVGDGG